MNHPASWIALQLSDSAFPSGGFVHSGGLEAAWRTGELSGAGDLDTFVDNTLWQAGSAQWPFSGSTYADPQSHARADGAMNAFLIGHVSNRVSRQQGRALLGATARIFDHATIGELDTRIRRRETHGHFAPAFGIVTRALGVSREDACRITLYAALRGVTSAAVRLGLVGPHEAQRMTHSRVGLLDSVLEASLPLEMEDAAQTTPILEIFATTHDLLDERLFVS